jgi:sulfofructose kinase
MLVTGIGQCSLDYLAVVDAYPHANTKKEVLEWSEQGGGPVATALVTLARLGIAARFYGVAGDDGPGEKIRKFLVNEDIDTRVIKRKGKSSQIAFIAVEKGTGRRTIFWKRPSGEELKKTELDTDFLKGADYLLLDGLMADISLYAAARARERGIPIMLDAGRLRQGMLEIAALSDHLVASEEFARDLKWRLTAEALGKRREELGCKVLTVTLGERGSITVSDKGLLRVPAFTVKTVDTTGAGDVFHGAFISGLLQKWELKDIIVFASAVAAMKCTKAGGRAGIPSLSEVTTFISGTTSSPQALF